MQDIFITINHIEDYGGYFRFRVGDELSLEKEDNPYDDEAIAVYKNDIKCGYVANSVVSVSRGTYSSGRLYDKIKEKAKCIIAFINEDRIIAKLDRGGK